MSGPAAIGMVSASLRNLLVGELSLTTPKVEVTLLAPDETGPERRINLFLYKVTENPFLKNQDWTVQSGPERLVPPPLSLSLYYLLTPYAKNDEVAGNKSAHEILGDAMRVLYEFPVVPSGYLDPGLTAARESLQIASNALDPEEVSRIWTTFAQPYRLSVLYQVSTVQVDRLTGTGTPVPQRVRQIGVPGVRAPYRPPVVDALTPATAAAGSTVTFAGSDLAGWHADALIGDRVMLSAEALTDDTFSATVPADLAPGVYDVRVDVSALYRRVFTLEVTP
jgi:hypothetical protein